MTDISPRLRAALEGGYELERELGAGGMATVYLARDRKHDRRVAVKVLKPELAAALGTERSVAKDPGRVFGAPVWTPDGTAIVFRGQDVRTLVVRAQASELLEQARKAQRSGSGEGGQGG